MSARPRRPVRYQTPPTTHLPGRPPVRGTGPPRYPDRRYRRRRSSCGSILLATVLLFVVIVAAGSVFIYRRWQDAMETVQDIPPVPADGQGLPNITQQPFNILLVGVDSRSSDPSDGARSDTLILVHVDPNNNWASMLSIPRDSQAYIPYLDSYQKINAAYSYGYRNAERLFGPDIDPAHAAISVTTDVVERFLDLRAHNTRIHYRAQIDFNGFKQVVDALGGVTVNVAKPLIDPQYPSDDGDHGYIRLFIPAGLQHLDGTTALRYARSRHQDADFGRSQRQQQVLRALLHSVKERELIGQIIAGDAILQQLTKSVSTDLPLKDPLALKALASLASSLSGDRIISKSINTQTVGYDRIVNESTIVWNESDLSQLVEEWLHMPASLQQPASEEGQRAIASVSQVQVLNGAGIAGLAGQVTGYLEGHGFSMLTAANASRTYEHTMLIDYSDQPQTRSELADLLGIKQSNIRVQPDETDAPPRPEGADIILILGLDYREEWRGAGGS